jgi:hypothetical protein
MTTQGPAPTGDATGGIIPYKNPAALIAYYCGVFSIVPCLGLFAGIPAVVLGIIGLRARRRNPIIKGAVHAWIGIVLGGLMSLLWIVVIIFMIIGVAASRNLPEPVHRAPSSTAPR